MGRSPRRPRPGARRLVRQRPPDRRLRTHRHHQLRRRLRRGWIPPSNGAEIEITSVPSPPNLADYIRRQLAGPGVAPLEETTEGANSGIKATYLESVNAGASLKTIVDYIPHGGSLYQFYLTYWTGDRNEPALALSLSNVVRGAQLR